MTCGLQPVPALTCGYWLSGAFLPPGVFLGSLTPGLKKQLEKMEDGKSSGSFRVLI